MNNIRIPDSIPGDDKLRAMQIVAQMKAAADKAGAKFIGGFLAPDGERFIMSNMDESDPDHIIPDILS